MKRILSLVLSLLLCVSVFPAASAEPSSAVVTIDGIRTAFFAEDGTYLPPIEENGLVYVPFLSLAESLSLNAEADTEKLIISVDGIRIAMFAKDGSYLPPMEKDGILYVPLQAFAESTGIQLSVDGNTYTLSRKSEAGTPAEQLPEATAVPMYADIPLTVDNYRDYFILSQNYYAPDGYPSPFSVTYTLTIQASTSYGLKNVVFRVKDYGKVQVPASGYASASYRTESIYESGYDKKDYIVEVTDMKTRAILAVALAPDVTAVDGYIRMPWAEAEALWEKEYNNAAGRIDKATTSNELNKIIAKLEWLVQQDYKDSAEQLTKAREKRREVKAQEEKAAADAAAKAREEEEKANAEQYDAATKALEEGKYQEAADTFSKLAEKKYKDSEDKLKEAEAALAAEQETLRRDNLYTQALADAENQQWKSSYEVMKELTDLGYGDAESRLPDLAYHRICQLTDQGETGTAKALFEKHRASFSQDQQDELTEAIDEKDITGLVATGEYLQAYEALIPYRDRDWAQQPLLLCRFRLGTCTALTDSGNIWFIEPDGQTKALITPELQILRENEPTDLQAWQYSDTGDPLNTEHYSRISGFHNGYAIAVRDGKQYLIDPQGQETELPEKYNYVAASAPTMLCFKNDKGKYGCTDTKGKITVKADYDQEIILQNGLARVVKIDTKQSDKKGTDTAFSAVVDENGKIVIKTGKYIECFPVAEDKIVVVTGKAGKNGLVQKQALVVDRKGKTVSGSKTIDSWGGDLTDVRRVGAVLFVASGGSWSKGKKSWKCWTTNLTRVNKVKEFDYLPTVIHNSVIVDYPAGKQICTVTCFLLDDPDRFIHDCGELILNEQSDRLLVKNSKDGCWYLYNIRAEILL